MMLVVTTTGKGDDPMFALINTCTVIILLEDAVLENCYEYYSNCWLLCLDTVDIWTVDADKVDNYCGPKRQSPPESPTQEMTWIELPPEKRAISKQTYHSYKRRLHTSSFQFQYEDHCSCEFHQRAILPLHKLRHMFLLMWDTCTFQGYLR